MQLILLAIGIILPNFLVGVSFMALAILALCRVLQRKNAMFE